MYKSMNKGTWEYIKTIAKKERVKIAVVIEHMAELHAKETGQESPIKNLTGNLSGKGIL